MNHRKRNFLRAALAAAIGPGVATAAHAAPPMKVGFIFLGPVGDVGWTHQHDLGRQAMQKALGSQVSVRAVANTTEADAERIARELSADGAKLVFAASFGFMRPVLRVAKANPDKFYDTASSYIVTPNAGGYNAKWYEGGYLAGIVAAKATRSNVIGFVGAFPVPDVVWDLNGFTLGARSVNPKAEVRTVFVNSWYDPPKEREAAIALINSGADVITHFTDTAAVVSAAEELGVPTISFHSDMSKYAPKHYLTGITHNWGDYYTKVVREVMAGTWKPRLYLGGLKEGVVKLAPFGASVPKDVIELVEARQRAIVSGKLNVFAGPIKDQKGVVRVKAGAAYPIAELGKMDWFVEGVTGASGK